MVTDRTLRDFGLLMAGMIGGIFGLLFPLLKRRPLPWTPWAIALVFAVLAVARPAALSLVYRGWMRFGALLGAINSRIILGVMFWVFITPFGLFCRLIRRDVLRLRSRDPEAKTYRVMLEPASDPKDRMERPF